MNTDIRYIFLDLGGTFRVIDKDPAYLAASGMMHTGNGR